MTKLSLSFLLMISQAVQRRTRLHMGSSGENGLTSAQGAFRRFGGQKKFEMKNFGERQRQIEEEVKDPH